MQCAITVLLLTVGPEPQDNVVLSGGDVDQSITFTAGSSAGTSISISVTITDDNVGLEDVEQYALTLRNQSITTNVNLGGDTTISITDNEGGSFKCTAYMDRSRCIHTHTCPHPQIYT